MVFKNARCAAQRSIVREVPRRDVPNKQPGIKQVHSFIKIFIQKRAPEVGLPVDLLREEFGDEPFVIWAKSYGIRKGVGLGVEIVGVKGKNILESLFVCLTFKIGVSPLAMPGVERVISDHVQSGLREG